MIRLVQTAVLAIFLAACSKPSVMFSSEKLITDGYANYKTYAFLPTSDTQYAKMVNRAALVPALKEEAMKELAAKGFTLDTQNPDVLFTYHLVMNRKYDVDRQQNIAYNNTATNVANVPMYNYSNSAVLGSTVVRSGTAPGSDVYYFSSDNRPYSYGGAVQIDTLRTGSMVIDMIDAKTKKVVWRSVAEGTKYESEKLPPEKAVKTYLPKMLKGLPRK